MKKLILSLLFLIVLISSVSAFHPNIRFINESDDDMVVIEKTQGNVTLAKSGWFRGLFNWTILSGISQRYLTFTGIFLSFNETKINEKIGRAHV